MKNDKKEDPKVHSEILEGQQSVSEDKRSEDKRPEDKRREKTTGAGSVEEKLTEQFVSPEVDSLDFPSRKELEDKLTAMEGQVDQYKNQLLRAQAELENVRRRADREVSNAHRFGVEKLLVELLPVIDSLTRALENSTSKHEKIASVRDGMQLTLNMLQKVVVKFGLEEINPKVGEPFNPEYHEAMSTLSDPDAPPNSIYEVVQKGYQLNGRVLRAAMVVVAKN